MKYLLSSAAALLACSCAFHEPKSERVTLRGGSEVAGLKVRDVYPEYAVVWWPHCVKPAMLKPGRAAEYDDHRLTLIRINPRNRSADFEHTWREFRPHFISLQKNKTNPSHETP